MVIKLVTLEADETANTLCGFDTPIPTLPLSKIVILSTLLESANVNPLPDPVPFPVIDSFALGLDEPIPMVPIFLSIQNRGDEVPTAKSALPVGVDDAM